MQLPSRASLLCAALLLPGFSLGAVKYQCSTWKNVRTGASGGFSTGIIFNPNHKNLAYLRTDIGGVYRFNSWDDTWTPLIDGITDVDWDIWGADGIATDPTEVSRFYVLAGMYTNLWDPNNATILRSVDYGATFQRTPLPFKAGGNQGGRGLGERIVVDPNRGNILLLGARVGNGLWRSTDYGATWAKVTSFTTVGDYPDQSSNTNPWASPNDIIGPTWILFDESSSSKGSATKVIYVAVALQSGPQIFVSKDAGATWSAIPGQPQEGYIPHKGKISPKENVLYISYGVGAGPNDGSAGSVWKYNLKTGNWTDITPEKGGFGFGGLSVDLSRPGTLMVAALNMWWPDTQIYRSLDGGATWNKTWELVWPNYIPSFDYDISTAPWLQDFNDGSQFRKLVGHWIETLEIDPFDSNHFLYATGATVQGSKNLLKWDAGSKWTLSSLSVGVEETAVLDLTSPQSGPPLLSGTGDVGGWVHNSIDIAPKTHHRWGNIAAVDYAGSVPATLIRGGATVDISTNSGANWTTVGGSIGSAGSTAVTADGKVIITQGSGSTYRSENSADFISSAAGLPNSAAIFSDKRNASLIYGINGGDFYTSEDKGLTFTKLTTAPSTYFNDVAPNPFKAGDLWITANNGVFHTKYPFTNWTQAADIAKGVVISVGAPKTASAYPSVFLVGYSSPDWTQGVYRSDDEGKNWVKTNDNAKNGFASTGSARLAADTRKWGRVYIGTNGRGIFYGDPSCAAPVF